MTMFPFFKKSGILNKENMHAYMYVRVCVRESELWKLVEYIPCFPYYLSCCLVKLPCITYSLNSFIYYI